MAEKIEPRSPSAPPAGRPASARGPDAADAIAILHPERQALIADRMIEVREYGYVEGLKLQGACKAFLDDLYGAFQRADAPPSAEEIADLMALHIITVQWLVGQAITPLQDDPEAFVAGVASNARWIGGLGEDDGDLLVALWWEVNKRFFTRRLQRRALAAGAVARQASLSASSASTTP